MLQNHDVGYCDHSKVEDSRNHEAKIHATCICAAFGSQQLQRTQPVFTVARCCTVFYTSPRLCNMAGEVAIISSAFLTFLMSVDGDARTEKWVLDASAYLVVQLLKDCC